MITFSVASKYAIYYNKSLRRTSIDLIVLLYVCINRCHIYNFKCIEDAFVTRIRMRYIFLKIFLQIHIYICAPVSTIRRSNDSRNKMRFSYQCRWHQAINFLKKLATADADVFTREIIKVLIYHAIAVGINSFKSKFRNTRF